MYVPCIVYNSHHTCTQDAPRIGIAPTRQTIQDFIDCTYIQPPLNDILFTAFATTL